MRALVRLAAALVVAVALALACDAEDGTEAGTGDAAAGASADEVVTDSGLRITALEEGTGPSPSADDTVRVHYHGTFQDGGVFDSSVERGQPAVFPLRRVIPCWTEGLQRMKVGGIESG